MNSYIAAVRTYGRMLSLFLLLLLILDTTGSHKARANGVVSTIGNGQIVYGSVSGTNYDTYTIHADSSSAIEWTITGTSAYDARFASEADLYRPSGTLANYAYGYYFSGNYVPTGIYGGTWTIYVENAYGSSYPSVSGSYALQAFVLPGQPGQSGGVGGGQMNVGQTYSGSVNMGSTDVYNFNGVSGNNYSVTLGLVSGTANFYPWMMGSDTTGSYFFTDYATSTVTYTHSAIDGPYTVLVNQLNVGGAYSGDYTLEVSGLGTTQPVGGKNDGCACGHPGGTAVGEPINIATGDVFDKVTDYTTVGTNPLAFTRYYNSLSYTRNGYPTLMGPNWRTNYDRYLRVVSASAGRRRNARTAGSSISSWSASVWTPDTDVDIKLTNSGSTYTLTDSDDVVETYTVTSGKGTLSSIAWPNGYTQTMNYTQRCADLGVGFLQPLAVLHLYKRRADRRHHARQRDADLRLHDRTAGQSLLTSVTYNTSPSPARPMSTATPSCPFTLTGITDENGNSNAQWTYDGAGPRTMSEHAGGADEVPGFLRRFHRQPHGDRPARRAGDLQIHDAAGRAESHRDRPRRESSPVASASA